MKRLILSTFLIALLFSCKKESNTKQSENGLDTLENNSFTDTLSVNKPVKKSIKQLRGELTEKGFETYDYVDDITNDTIIMQKYFIVFLKSGPIRSQNEEEAEILQKEHLDYLAKMYDMGYADISGSLSDKSAIRDITVYNVPTLKMADSLAKADPMVKNGNLIVEVHPWWTAKGHTLR